MESTFEWGMDWIIAMQEMGGPFVEDIFLLLTYTGEEVFYLLLVPIIFWAFDRRIGTRVGFAFLITAYVNPILKDFFPEPRPYQVNPEVSAYEWPGSGMPSGHAQSTVFVWGTLAWQIGRGWFWGLAIAWMFLVGISRAYLGVHFPHQVVAGWLVGAILLALFVIIDPRFEAWMVSLSLGYQLAISISIPLLLALAYPHNDTVASAAVMCGLGSGFVLMRRYCPYSASGLWRQRVLRTGIGLVGLLALYIGLSAVFPGEEDTSRSLYDTLRFVRYGLLGLWISLGAPWVFSLLPPLQQQGREPEPKPAAN